MPMYIFFPCLEDGSSTSFEAYELEDDAAARERAGQVLESHDSAVQVMVWRDGVALAPLGRPTPPRSSPSSEGESEGA
jgi:hypothetical protein